MKKTYVNTSFPHFVHGGDYNPEQWIDYPGIWDDDMRLMKAANWNEATIGIFSWSMLEPEDGKYDFSFLDKTIENITKNGGRFILATPSGARPHWLADKYPSVLRVGRDGVREHYNARHNHCMTSPEYRRKVREINSLLAERYGSHPGLLAWHISNEYCGECYCPLCAEKFRGYLRERYHNDIGELNHAYWTTFWSHKYDSFDQIEPPADHAEQGLSGLNLDWHRFTTDNVIDFIKNEIAPIKAVSPSVPVTTNMMYEFFDYDYSKFASVLDFASWDSYPEWHNGDQERTAETTAFWHDYYRSMFGKPFFLMESTPSLVNWKQYNKLKRPGMDNLAAVQAVGHGSDSVQYFQWRKSRGSGEKLHGAVVDHVGNEDTRVFRAVKKTGEILGVLDEICGTSVKAEAAVIFDWESWWALSDAQGFRKDDKKYPETCYEYHRALWKHGINCDVIPPYADLSGYKLVIAPMLYLTDEETVRNLTAFVENGGTLYATYMLGMVNESDLCNLGGFPAYGLKDVFGIWNEEIETLLPDERITVKLGDKSYSAVDYAESIHLRGANAAAVYEDGIFAGSPAVTVNEYGKGKAVYQAFRDTGDIADEVMSRLAEEAGIVRSLPVGTLPHAVTAHTRTDGENTYLFVENYSDDAASGIVLGGEFMNMLTGERESVCDLSAYGFAVYKK